MMKLHKSRVALAVGAALGALALMPATSYGWSVNTSARATCSPLTGGDTLLFPIYTTVGTTATSFSVTNTSNEQTIAAKIRFREQTKSMDVLDFYVILSPNDKFDFFVNKNGPRPTMRWSDNSCVVGPSITGVQPFPAPSAFVDSDEDMAVGHLEVLGVADISDVWVLARRGRCARTTGAGSLAAAAKHGPDGEPANCAALVNWLASPTNVQKLNVDLRCPFKDVGNVLVGRYVITVEGQGIEAGSDAIGIRDSNLGPPASDMTAQSGAPCSAARTAYPMTMPGTRTSGITRTWVRWPTSTGFQTALTAANVAGDWSNNPANFVGVDWVLSFPNKYAYLDKYTGSDCPTTEACWHLLPTTKTETDSEPVDDQPHHRPVPERQPARRL